jgi:stage V sporulation protein D (sporulation-specific penicillin-binding protein)
LQLITAYASIANGGKLLRPYIVDYKEKDNGYQEKTEVHEVRQVFSAQTSRMLSAMLTNVVEKGSGKSAGVKGYFMAGKTGTAQIVKEDGSGYDAVRHKDTYVGFGPVSNPRFIILVKIDDPQNALWAENTTAPLAGEISKYILEYYKIPPDRE